MDGTHDFTESHERNASQRSAFDRVDGAPEAESRSDVVGDVEAASAKRRAAFEIVEGQHVGRLLAKRCLRHGPILGTIRDVQRGRRRAEEFIEGCERCHRQRHVILGERGELGELIDDRGLTGQLGVVPARFLESGVCAGETLIQRGKAPARARRAAGETNGEHDHQQQEGTDGDREVEQESIDVGVELAERGGDRDDAVRIRNGSVADAVRDTGFRERRGAGPCRHDRGRRDSPGV